MVQPEVHLTPIALCPQPWDTPAARLVHLRKFTTASDTTHIADWAHVIVKATV